MYYWGDYSRSLYKLKKEPNDENLIKHKQELENIIENSKSMTLRVPPGVYAELGYIYFKQNNDKLAFQYFNMEETIYPESKILMIRCKQAIELRQKKESTANKESTSQTSIKNESSESGIKNEKIP